MMTTTTQSLTMILAGTVVMVMTIIGLVLSIDPLTLRDPATKSLPQATDAHGGVWTTVPGVPALGDVAAAAAKGERLAVFAASGKFIESRDRGRTWISGQLTLADALLSITAAAFDAEGRLYAAAGAGESAHLWLYAEDSVRGSLTLMYEADRGAAVASVSGVMAGAGGTVTRLTRAPEAFGVPGAEEVMLYGITSDREGKMMVVGDYGFAATSKDAGRTWETRQLSQTALAGVTVTPSGTAVIVADRTLLRWREGEREASAVEGFPAGVTWHAVDQTSAGVVIAAGKSADASALLASSSDDGETWRVETTVGRDPEAPVSALLMTETDAWAVTARGRVLHREPKGAN